MKPYELDERLIDWEEKYEKLKHYDEEVSLHPESTLDNRDDQRLENETRAYRRARAAVKKLHDESEAASAARAATSASQATVAPEMAAMESAKRPPQLEREENLKTFTDWRRVWRNYAEVINIEAKSQPQQIGKFVWNASPSVL